MLQTSNLRSSILIVDDEADVREVVGEILSEYYRVIFARGGIEGVEVAGRAHPDLILLDIMMPIQDGYVTCNQLKSHPETKSIPIIMLSAKNDSASRVEAFKEGADDYISKPFHPEELLVRVLAKLRKSQDSPQKVKQGTAMGLKTELREMELRIFNVLRNRLGVVLTRDEICREIWGAQSQDKHRNLDPHVSSLRKKLKSSDWKLSTLYGQGYVLNKASHLHSSSI